MGNHRGEITGGKSPGGNRREIMGPNKPTKEPPAPVNDQPPVNGRPAVKALAAPYAIQAKDRQDEKTLEEVKRINIDQKTHVLVLRVRSRPMVHKTGKTDIYPRLD